MQKVSFRNFPLLASWRRKSTARKNKMVEKLVRKILCEKQSIFPSPFIIGAKECAKFIPGAKAYLLDAVELSQRCKVCACPALIINNEQQTQFSYAIDRSLGQQGKTNFSFFLLVSCTFIFYQY